ncbi:MAG: hypothetical protein BGO69_06680 [Bacteroidetes bacterium 46-16]|nr:MAG: hypothetical protein BGO69_06680 [Bacteroidetes bacterium 46-16]
MNFYHYSHFFALLAEVYFGGIALFSFFEKGAVQLKGHLEYKEQLAILYNSRIEEFSRMVIPRGEASRRIQRIKRWTYRLFLKGIKKINLICFNVSSFFIHRSHEEHTVSKRFFPAFFYNGCFCVVMVLLTAIAEEFKEPECVNYIHNFILYYLKFSVLFYFYVFLIFPYLIKKYNYIILTFLNFLICLLFFVLALIFSNNPPGKQLLEYTLEPNIEVKAVVLVILFSLVPLIYIALNYIILMLFWSSLSSVNKVIAIIGRNEVNEIFKK